MKKLILNKSLIPEGLYCYRCPYYFSRGLVFKNEEYPSTGIGNTAFCAFLQMDDNMIAKRFGSSLLWDRCKECGKNKGHAF